MINWHNILKWILKIMTAAIVALVVYFYFMGHDAIFNKPNDQSQLDNSVSDAIAEYNAEILTQNPLDSLVDAGGFNLETEDTAEYVYPTEEVNTDLQFRTEQKLEEHFQKHVIEQQEFGDISVEDYLYFAQELMTVVEGEDTLTKEIDGETFYYDAETNEFGVLSSDGYIKTFFKPSDGQAYFDRQ
ncbi:MAG: hypothetical protein E7297_11075 [Lachnospiraceae bacterium]|jgi:hypothetical protein|nr:hypothetical protein [Lachnospiraceae bacterium]